MVHLLLITDAILCDLCATCDVCGGALTLVQGREERWRGDIPVMEFNRLEEEGTKDDIPDMIPGPLPDRHGDPLSVLSWAW